MFTGFPHACPRFVDATARFEDEPLDLCLADTHELFGLPDGDQKLMICGWLPLRS